MGRIKANIPFGTSTMANHIAEKAKTAGFQPFLIKKIHQNIPSTFPILIEEEDRHHALLGIKTAMQHSPSELFLVLPCDAPYLSLESLSLFRQASAPVVAFHNGIHPLIGVYSTKDLHRAQYFIEQSHSMKHFCQSFDQMDCSSTDVRNINYPEDL